MIKNIFFDKNRCLIHVETKTYIALPDVMKDILKKFNTVGTTYQITRADRETYEELIGTFGLSSVKIYDYKLYLRYFLKRFFVKPTDAELESAYKMLLEARVRNMHAEQGAETALKALKGRGFRLYVLTNSYYERALYHLNTAGLLGYLDFVVTSDLVGSTKADKRMYRTAMELTKSKPRESIFVSSFEEDLTGASSAGMKTVLISSKISKDRSDFQVRNISEIPRLQLLR